MLVMSQQTRNPIASTWSLVAGDLREVTWLALPL